MTMLQNAVESIRLGVEDYKTAAEDEARALSSRPFVLQRVREHLEDCVMLDRREIPVCALEGNIRRPLRMGYDMRPSDLIPRTIWPPRKRNELRSQRRSLLPIRGQANR